MSGIKRRRRGDTLVEVAIAIGIFSLVAIAVASVVNATTSSAQSALEVTLVREEIDAQAEALRFIQSSYISGGQVNEQDDTELLKYKAIWEEIVKRAINPTASGSNLSYSPATCSELYNKNSEIGKVNENHAFIINTRKLGSSDTNDIVVGINSSFRQAATYPRILYDGASANQLLDNSTNASISQVEGIYVLAVRDEGSTYIVSDSASSDKRSAFYDFYIRTCWFTPGSDRPATISTVIRLQDPEAAIGSTAEEVKVTFSGNGNDGSIGQITTATQSGRTINLSAYDDTFKWKTSGTQCATADVLLAGWNKDPNANWDDPNNYRKDGYYRVGSESEQTLYAIWKTDCPCCFWFDVNTSLVTNASYRPNYSSSGRPGFPVKVYVNGKLIASSADMTWTNQSTNRPHITAEDWYSTVPLGARMEVHLSGPANSYIANTEEMCSDIYDCQWRRTGTSDYVVTFSILPTYLHAVEDSSGHFAMQLEPKWGCIDGSTTCLPSSTYY